MQGFFLQPFGAFLIGVTCGFVASIPGGPVNVGILNEGTQRGFLWAIFIGLGAVIMETTYCSLAFAGFAQMFDSRTIRAMMELSSFLLMLWLGIKYLLGGPLPGENRGVQLVEHRFHPHTAFWTGFVRVLGNPGILLLWLTVAAALLSHQWLSNTWACKWPFIGGVGTGGMLWFLLLSWGVARSHGRFSSHTLRRLSQLSGIFLLVVAVFIGARLVVLLRGIRDN